MTAYTIDRPDATMNNRGNLREYAFRLHYHAANLAHDNVAYDKGSDLDLADKHISIKSSAFSLMSGNLCEGIEDFDGIWALYAARVHSNVFAYVTADFTVYEMTIAEFKLFVYTFCRTERESKKNGGAMKIKCRKESGKMLRWLADRAAS